jgi:RND family efflux transporter MFP subunit
MAALMVALCICSVVTGCGETEEEVSSDVIPVTVQSPEAGTLTLKNEFIGTISPQESVYVIPMVSAEVLSADVSVGDEVEAGQILCKLDSEAAELQLASAQAQYDSVAASVDAAQVGYEIAQAQQESTDAQLDAQMGGQKNLQMYQLQIQVDTVQSGIDDIYKQLDDLAEDKADAEDKKDELKSAKNKANNVLQQAQAAYEAARQKVTELESPTSQTDTDASADTSGDHEAALKEAKENLAAAESAYEQAQTAATAAATAYEQAKAGIESIEDGEEQLNDTLADTYKSLEQAEAIKNITEEQVYGDTQKVVDASKKTAALSVDSAQASVNSAQAGMESAQVAIDSAEYQMDMYTLTAPIAGVIEAVNVSEHDFATPSSPAFVISNKDTMTVTFYVSEGIRNTLNVGQKVQADRNGTLYDAAITDIGSMVDQSTGLFEIKACVSDPDDSLLTGSSVKVTADTYSQDDALLIPYDAVYYDDSQPYVYVAVNNIAERRDIETGIFDEETITVLSGLSVEDQLITSWSANLRAGAEISVQAGDSALDNTEAAE